MREGVLELTTAQRHEAVGLVLRSGMFARTEQLRHLLGYLCEQEIAGRGAELTEYEIGVNALGRPASFSPLEDAVVRNRTHALRRKLTEVYRQELSAAPLRIELPKGTYQPRFVESSQAEIAPEPVREPAAALPGRRLIWLTVAIAAVAVISFEAGMVRGRRENIEPVFHRFWGPLLTRNSSVAICVAAPLQMTVREYGAKPPDDISFVPTGEIQRWYREQTPASTGAGLRLGPIRTSPRAGEAAAALTVAQFLGAAHVPIEILSERIVKLPALRNRNVVLFGSPEYSSLIGGLLVNTPFTVSYDPAREENLVIRRQPGGQVYGSISTEDPETREQYGLITVLPSERAAGQRTVVFSGTSSASTQGAAEYFTSIGSLTELDRKIPHSLVAGYQIVVRVKISIGTPLRVTLVSYETF